MLSNISIPNLSVKCSCGRGHAEQTYRMLNKTGRLCEHCGEPIWAFELIPEPVPNQVMGSRFGERCFGLECPTFTPRLFSKAFIDLVRTQGIQDGSVFAVEPVVCSPPLTID